VTVGIYSLELHLPAARSLKDRRQVVRRLKDRLRARHNVAVAEDDAHADLWQRAGITIVSVARGRDAVTQIFEAVHREAEACVPGQVIELGQEFLDGAEGDDAAWGAGEEPE